MTTPCTRIYTARQTQFLQPIGGMRPEQTPRRTRDNASQPDPPPRRRDPRRARRNGADGDPGHETGPLQAAQFERAVASRDTTGLASRILTDRRAIDEAGRLSTPFDVPVSGAVEAPARDCPTNGVTGPTRRAQLGGGISNDRDDRACAGSD
ncbi:hypothetical protein GCM10017691_18840 [Pseudonocardia petroleophila]